MEVVLNNSNSPFEATRADLDRSLATCCFESGLKLAAAWNACFRIFMLSIPVITTEVGRFKA
jgi:hypothetical protein